MSRARVHVGISSYNHAPFVAQAVRSVVAQSFTDWRLTVIDDGSTDESVDVLRALIAELADPRIELVTRANRGLCFTLNQIVAGVDAELFAYLGSDDWWHPDKLARQVASMSATDGACYCDCYIVDGGPERRFGQMFTYRGGDLYRDIVYSRLMPPSPTNLFRTRALRDVGGFNEAIFLEDRDLWLRLTRRYRVAFVDAPLAYYRVHADNLSTNNPRRMFHASEQSLARLLFEDPFIAGEASALRARNLAWLAAAEYHRGELSEAIAIAASAIAKSPTETLAWDIGLRAIAKLILRPLGVGNRAGRRA